MKNTKMENNRYFTQSLQTLSYSDLSIMNSMIIDMMKAKRQRVAQRVKRHVNIGDYVTVHDDRFGGRKLLVRKLNPKKALLEDEMFDQTWRVPYSLIDTVDRMEVA
jgi:hypothetical protein